MATVNMRGLVAKISPKITPMAKHLLKSGVIVSAMTLISRVLGLVREVVLANLLGAGMGADLFFVAQKIPNFLRRLFAEGAFAQAFVPVFAEYQLKRSQEEVLQLLNKVAGTLGLIVLGLTVLVLIAAPWVTTVYAPGFRDDPVKFELAVYMLRITFPYLLFISLTALAGSVLNTRNRFAVPAITPVFLNVCLIIAGVWVAPELDRQAVAMAWAVLIAGVVQLAFNLPFLWREGLLPRPVWGWKDEGVQRILKLMLPAMFGVSITQISLMLDVIFLSFLEEGSVSWLYYADRLLEFPLGLFGIAIATVILPSLSRQHSSEDAASFQSTIDWALKFLTLIGLPAMIGLGMLADGLALTLFQHGATTVQDAANIADALILYSLGLMSFMSIKVLATGFFGRQDTKTPVKFALISVAFNMVANAILIWPLQYLGLALATTLSSTLNATLLFRTLYKRGIYRPQAGWGSWLLKVGAACAAMAVVIYLVHPGNEAWAIADHWQRILFTGQTVAAGAASYFAVLWLMGMRISQLRGYTPSP